MRAGRYAPLVLGALFAVRVVACGGGGKTGGAGGTGGASATCVNGDISYETSSGQLATHACTSHDCWIDAATGSGACTKPDAPGVKPFRTCRAAADCSGATYCATWGDGFTMLLGSATCVDGVCDWATQAQQACTGGQLCWPTACATVYTGTTSGGFPWEPCDPQRNPNCAGAGGTGGSTGGTGGPGGAGAAGGSTGSVDPAATCVNGDISYVTSGGDTPTHACPNHDCWIDAATGSAACTKPSAPGVKPFRTCRAATDCSGATYCATWGDSFTMLLGSATCVDNACDWATEAQQACTGGQLCWPTACATVFTGTTSGGFPWEPPRCGGGGGCPGAGGTGGASGATGTGTGGATGP
jgi:hypothetical protein